MRAKNVFIIIVLMAMFASCKEEVATEKAIKPVKVFQIEGLSAGSSQVYPAVSKEVDKATLSFRVSGPLVKFDIQEGQRVAKGQLIAEIDSRDFKINLAAKKAVFEQSKAEVVRFRNLFAKKSIAENELDKYEANYQLAKSDYEAAQNALADTKLFAPFAGAIENKMVNNFEKVVADQDIVSIMDFSTLEIKLYISVNLAVNNRNFESYDVTFDTYPGKVFSASFKEIGKKAEGGLGVPLTLSLIQSDMERKETPIGAGMACNVTIRLKDKFVDEVKDFITIPLSAVFPVDSHGKNAVWVYNPASNTVTQRIVEVVKLTLEKSAEIGSGLQPGEYVVTAGVTKLEEGQTVKLAAEIK